MVCGLTIHFLSFSYSFSLHSYRDGRLQLSDQISAVDNHIYGNCPPQPIGILPEDNNNINPALVNPNLTKCSLIDEKITSSITNSASDNTGDYESRRRKLSESTSLIDKEIVEDKPSQEMVCIWVMSTFFFLANY